VQLTIIKDSGIKMLEKILYFSIQRRWLVMVGVLALVLYGLYNYQSLTIDAVPDITNVQVQINTEAQGYSPLESEQQITFHIETALGGIPSLEYTRSVSRYGLSQVTAVFQDGTDIYFARQQINQRLQEVRSKLPPQIEPQMGPISTGLGEIFMYTVEADLNARDNGRSSYSHMELRTIHDWIIRPQLRTVSGVVEVNTIGGYEKQVHVLPKPLAMSALQVGMQEVSEALEKNNQNTGAGYIERNGEQYLIRFQGQRNTLEELRSIVVKSSHGIPTRIKDVADVSFGSDLRSGAATKDGREVVLGTVFMLIGQNSREVSMRVAERLAEINKSLPKGVHARTVYDRTTLVNATVATVEKNLLEGALLVVVVLLILLGNLRAALITACVIPLSMLFTITGMVTTKMSGNLMSLGALDFGIIVDGAVIIVENCMRGLAEAQVRIGKVLSLKERLEIVFKSTREVRRATLFGELIIMIVYLPILTLTGIEGKMFTPMALTVLLALLGAMILSVTFVPAAVAILLSRPIKEHDTLTLSLLKKMYRATLEGILRVRFGVIVVALAFLSLTVFLGRELGSEFIPYLDEGDLAVHSLRPPGTSLSQSVHMQNAVEEKFKTFPEVKETLSKIGTADIATDPMPPSVADGFVFLKPRSEWPNPKRSKADLVAHMERELSKVPGQKYEFLQPIQMRFNELIAGVRSEVAVKIFGDDLEILEEEGRKVEKILGNVAGASGVNIEQVTGLPVLTFQVKQDAAARFGVSTSDLQELIRTTLSGRSIGVILEGDRRFPIVLRLSERMRSDLATLTRLPIKLPRYIREAQASKVSFESERENHATFIALSELVDFEVSPGPNQVSRENGKRRIVVTSNIVGRDIGTFVREAQARIASQITPPPGYWITWGGQFEQLTLATQRLQFVVPLALLLILLLLYLSFQNVVQAALVFTGVPFALSGGILALSIRGIPFSISAAVGFIALSGVAVLNGLVMVSFINQLREEGTALHEAIVEGCLMRLRPILMTALVAALGFLPMAIATGPGAEVQRPLATVVIGGIITSTILSLVVLPVLISIVGKMSRQGP
jgi:heavy metal efflux system protein